METISISATENHRLVSIYNSSILLDSDWIIYWRDIDV